MVWVVWSLLWCMLLLLGCPLGSGGHVFLGGQEAAGVLHRQKRYNTFLEEFMKGNLERECLEEKCDLEEAREIFEDDEKTTEFWVDYVDGNRCQSRPCQNQGVCKALHGSYTCTCLLGFTGRNCEIVTGRRCDLNNGQCMHFCELTGTIGAKCSCAEGYKLARDSMNCDPEVEFPCGRDGFIAASVVSTRSLLVNQSAGLQNITPLTNNSTTASAVSPPANATVPSVVGLDRSRSRLPQWVLNNIHKEKDKIPVKRIVGGYSVNPGEIPWQVALIHHSGELFCGGSILNELWVITAAHCLVEGKRSFFIRAGEHNIRTHEGPEQERDVSEMHVHPRYNASASTYDNDIALLRLQRPLNFTRSVRPICLGPKDFTETLVKEASPGTVSGWGRTRFQGLTANTLQQVEVPFTVRTACQDSSSSRITQYMFCAGYRDKAKDSCQGDSGGPHTNRYRNTWFLTGIVSWGEECAKEGKYGVYTRVSHYYRWIRGVMGAKRQRLAVGLDEPDP